MQTLKKEIVSRLASSCATEQLKGNKIILVTSFGIISGDIILDDEPDQNISTLSNLSYLFAKDYREENHIPDGSLDGNDGFLPLKNVEIKSGSGTFHFNFLNVFFDQIVGVSIGNF